MSKPINDRKVAIIGCGFVGSSSAFALMQGGLFSEIVLVDVDRNRAEGEALDISHGMPFAHPCKIYAGDYNDIDDAAIIVITAGANQRVLTWSKRTSPFSRQSFPRSASAITRASFWWSATRSIF